MDRVKNYFRQKLDSFCCIQFFVGSNQQCLVALVCLKRVLEQQSPPVLG